MLDSIAPTLFNHNFIFGDNLIPFYQPIVDEGQFVVGYEAFGRRYNSKNEHWESIFVNHNDSESLLKLDLVIIEKIIKNVKKGQLDHLKFLSVNMTFRYDDPRYIDIIANLNQELSLRGVRLQLEILESQHIENYSSLMELSKFDIDFCLDDFGSEKSNLYRLILSPVNKIKIDRELFYSCVESEKKYNILKSIITAIKENNIKVTCEGIESQQHFDLAKGLGCDHFQGFFWSAAFTIG